MQDAGFLNTRKINPLGLTVIIGAHVAVLTAIAVSNPEIIHNPSVIYTEIYPVTEPPPPPPPPMPKVKPEPAQPTRIDPVIVVGPPTVPPIDLQPAKPIELTPPTPMDPPKAEPVFVSAAIQPGSSFQPEYPLALVRAGIEGFATVRVLIGADGRVKAVELVNAADPAFFDATKKQALRYWRFKPATSDGSPVESWRTMTVRFKIQS